MAIDMTRFQSFWHGDELPLYAKACLSSFLDHGHAFRLFAYKVLSVPTGIELADANAIVPQDRMFFYKNPDGSPRSVAGFTNLFRYELLTREGGWWVDTDVVCLNADIPVGAVFIGREDDNNVCNAILKMPRNHPLVSARQRAQAAGTDLAWGQTGPKLLTALLRDLSLTAVPVAPLLCYPIPFSGYDRPMRRSEHEFVRSAIRLSPFLHLWNEMFRLQRSDLINAPEQGSFMHDIYRKHNVLHRSYTTAGSMRR